MSPRTPQSRVPPSTTVPTPSPNKLRIYILTASFAAITATGAWYGAGLKAQQDFKQERQAQLQISPAERIEQLENARALMVRQKRELQVKIDRLSKRAEQRDAESVSVKQKDG